VTEQQQKLNEHSECTYLGVDIDGLETRRGLETAIDCRRDVRSLVIPWHITAATQQQLKFHEVVLHGREDNICRHCETHGAGGLRCTAAEEATCSTRYTVDIVHCVQKRNTPKCLTSELPQKWVDLHKILYVVSQIHFCQTVIKFSHLISISHVNYLVKETLCYQRTPEYEVSAKAFFPTVDNRQRTIAT